MAIIIVPVRTTASQQFFFLDRARYESDFQIFIISLLQKKEKERTKRNK